MRLTILLFLLLFSLTGKAQTTPTQSLSGTVLNLVTHEPLIGAQVRLLKTTPAVSGLTDDGGDFIFMELPVGRYTVEVRYLGYATQVLPGVLLESGQATRLEVWMSEYSESLGEFTVTSTAGKMSALSPVSLETFSIEETERFAGSFYDPARLVTNFAGVANDNDQANGFSVRGNNPNANAWRLEGVEIVNPNHTPNAGTFSDLTTINAGGVFALSGQMLGNSALLKGAYPVEYGNVTGGLLDLYFKKAPTDREELVVQAGLIGLDLATSGPLFDSKVTFSSNLRYSFTGLLGLMGVDFGGEEISFSDISGNFHIPTSIGDFTVFSVVGISKNVFKKPEDPAEREEDKDLFDIDYENNLGIVGATHKSRIGDRGFWSTAFAYSQAESLRQAEQFDEDMQPLATQSFFTEQGKMSFRTDYDHQLNGRTSLSVGGMGTRHEYTYGRSDRRYVGFLFEPYAGLSSRLTDRLTANLGLRYAYFTLRRGDDNFEPRASLSYRLGSKNVLSAAYGRHSQLQHPAVYLASDPADVLNSRNSPLRRSEHYALSYRHSLNNSDQISVELFYQNLSDRTSIEADLGGPIGIRFLSNINYIGGTLPSPVYAIGSGTNYGAEFSYRRFLQDDWYYLANATLFESTFRASAGDTDDRDTRWAANYIGNLTIGKEWKRLKENGKQRTLGLNARMVLRGGYRDFAIDEAASEARQTSVYQLPLLTNQYPAYFRTDLRVYFRWDRGRRSSLLSLDIQNLTNRKNIAYTYYDRLAGGVTDKTQLGLIPVLNYRIELSKKQ